MAVLDDIRNAGRSALSAGVTAARGQGAALKGDFETLVRPDLDGIAAQIAGITESLVRGDIEADQAREAIADEMASIEPLILAVSELALLAVQVIINAVLDALKAAVNTATTHAIGFALL